MLLTSFCCLYCQLRTNFITFSSIPLVYWTDKNRFARLENRLEFLHGQNYALFQNYQKERDKSFNWKGMFNCYIKLDLMFLYDGNFRVHWVYRSQHSVRRLFSLLITSIITPLYGGCRTVSILWLHHKRSKVQIKNKTKVIVIYTDVFRTWTNFWKSS